MKGGCLRAADFHAVEVGIGAPEFFIELGGGEGAGGELLGDFFPLGGGEFIVLVFDAPLADLGIDGGVDLLLRLAHLGGDFRPAADDVERGPGEQGGDGVEIRGVGLAADAGGFERDGAAAAKGIAHAGDSPEARLPELGDKLRNGAGGGAEVGVDFFPTLWGRTVYLLRPVAEGDLLIVGKAGEDGEFEGFKSFTARNLLLAGGP